MIMVFGLPKPPKYVFKAAKYHFQQVIIDISKTVVYYIMLVVIDGF